VSKEGAMGAGAGKAGNNGGGNAALD